MVGLYVYSVSATEHTHYSNIVNCDKSVNPLTAGAAYIHIFNFY